MCVALEPPRSRLRLPVSGLDVGLTAPTGAEDVLLAEGRAEDPALALALARRLAQPPQGVDFGALPVPDVDALISEVRRLRLGDRIVAETVCRNPECRTRIDVSFGLGEYLEHHRPKRRPRHLLEAEGEAPGWFAFAGVAGAFRLPTFDDLVAVAKEDDPSEALAHRCWKSPRPDASIRRRVERALEAMAPTLGGPLEGRCMECGTAIEARFDARLFCLQELCDRAQFVYDDVDAIAARHHWSEAEILALPGERRIQYAERARQSRASTGV
jgi:hypothetical protein